MNKEAYVKRFLSRTTRDGDCWLWTGATGSAGYGQAQWNGYRTGAHRVSWLLFRGKIPHSLELDHLCRNRLCVNPDHLEPVTHAENKARAARAAQPLCKCGAAFTITRKGNRICKPCRAAYARRWRDANPGAASEACRRYQQRKRAEPL